jgi:hypothetical protein
MVEISFNLFSNQITDEVLVKLVTLELVVFATITTIVTGSLMRRLRLLVWMPIRKFIEQLLIDLAMSEYEGNPPASIRRSESLAAELLRNNQALHYRFILLSVLDYVVNRILPPLATAFGLLACLFVTIGVYPALIVFIAIWNYIWFSLKYSTAPLRAPLMRSIPGSGSIRASAAEHTMMATTERHPMLELEERIRYLRSIWVSPLTLTNQLGLVVAWVWFNAAFLGAGCLLSRTRPSKTFESRIVVFLIC